MSKDPALLVYTADLSIEISDLTLEERGQYLTMVLLQHQKGALSPKLLALQLGKNPSKDVLNKCVINKNGDCYIVWVETERDRRKAHSKKQRENINKRWQKQTKEIPKHYDGITTVLPLETETETVTVTKTKDKTKNKTIDVELWPSFNDFWNTYNKKIGKKKIIYKWQMLPYKTKLKIMEHLPQYIASTPEKQFRKDPETYLNNEAWTNEVIFNTNQNGSKQNNPYAKLEQQNVKKINANKLFNKY